MNDPRELIIPGKEKKKNIMLEDMMVAALKGFINDANYVMGYLVWIANEYLWTLSNKMLEITDLLEYLEHYKNRVESLHQLEFPMENNDQSGGNVEN